jgi:RNA polymerase sigma-70 factor (ECF subfamily)
LAAKSDEIGGLIVAVGHGDRAAFRRLYIATSPKLMGVVVRITKTRAEAEEVLQEVYLKVWGSASTFSLEAGTGIGWLVSIARNRAIDIARSRKAAATDNQDTDWFDRIASAGNLEGEIMDRTALVGCLEGLERPVRDMIVLAYIDGASREELAERFASPVNTIKTKLHRGLAALKACLEGTS